MVIKKTESLHISMKLARSRRREISVTIKMREYKLFTIKMGKFRKNIK
jgi:hypothetical protein